MKFNGNVIYIHISLCVVLFVPGQLYASATLFPITEGILVRTFYFHISLIVLLDFEQYGHKSFAFYEF